MTRFTMVLDDAFNCSDNLHAVQTFIPTRRTWSIIHTWGPYGMVLEWNLRLRPRHGATFLVTSDRENFYARIKHLSVDLPLQDIVIPHPGLDQVDFSDRLTSSHHIREIYAGEPPNLLGNFTYPLLMAEQMLEKAEYEQAKVIAHEILFRKLHMLACWKFPVWLPFRSVQIYHRSLSFLSSICLYSCFS